MLENPAFFPNLQARFGKTAPREAFNAAWKSYGRKNPARREEIAHRVAWAAVKRRYCKVGAVWLPLKSTE
jgi:cation transport regulator